ncbi:uncharacterized protein LOC105689928 isoform X1 [Athalia rosae]|uniref:uncharacterized protein LOC105689928 isoform X1 n=1 Tax=Athalia rosae TaxID=37344 RepID=UPI0020341747|nr:uncharacterized protein LOC105689928 isoform X1 [Athalia rosae]
MNANDGGFWATVDLLVGLRGGGYCRENMDPFKEDVNEWLESVTSRVKMQLERDKLARETSCDKQTKIEEEKEIGDYGSMIECSFSYPPVRTRLEMLMGSNVVRLTDRRYMQKLITRIRQDYEASQQERVGKRVTKELMRTKKMILERLIPVQEAPDELRKYPLFQLYLYCDAIIEEKQRKRMPKKVRVTDSLYQLLYPENKGNEAEEDNANDEIYMKTVVVNGAQKLIPMTANEIAAIMSEQESAKDIENGYLLSQEDYDRLYFETDAIKELREMQSVEEMYTKAHEIVGILYSYADEGRYQKAALEKQRMEAENIEATDTPAPDLSSSSAALSPKSGE